MGQTLNGNIDTSATNGFTPGDCNQRGIGYSASQVDANKTQWVEWAALVKARGFDPNTLINSSSLGAPLQVPQPIFNQVAPVPAPIITTKKTDGSTATANGLIPNTSIVFKSPA